MPQTRLEDAQTGPLKNSKKALTCADTPESDDNHQKGNIDGALMVLRPGRTVLARSRRLARWWRSRNRSVCTSKLPCCSHFLSWSKSAVTLSAPSP